MRSLSVRTIVCTGSTAVRDSGSDETGCCKERNGGREQVSAEKRIVGENVGGAAEAQDQIGC